MNDFYTFDPQLYVAGRCFVEAYKISTYKSIQAQFLTLNCGNSSPTIELQRLVVPDCELYAISLQEIDTDPEVFLSGFSRVTSEYTAFFDSAIRLRRFQKQLGSELLIIYVSNDIELHSVDFFAVPTGNLGLANKGGIICKIRAYQAVIGVVGCHLNAERGASGAERRNSDFLKILGSGCDCIEYNKEYQLWKLLQEIPYNSTEKWQFDPHDTLHRLKKMPQTLADCDLLIVGGDLNYRVVTELMDVQIAAAIAGEDSSAFLERYRSGDQLSVEMHYFNANSDFQDFSERNSMCINNIEESDVCGLFNYVKEQEITFKPTYCLVPRTANYQVTEEKSRTPSYTDRILWFPISADDVIEPGKYEALDYAESDHRPVSLTSTLKLRILTAEKLREYEEMLALEAADSLAALKPSFSMQCAAEKVLISPLKLSIARVCLRNIHIEEYVKLGVTVNHKFAILRDEQVEIAPGESISVPIALLADPTSFASLTDFTACALGPPESCEIHVTHSRGEIVEEREKLSFLCEMAEVEEFCSALGDARLFVNMYNNVYSVLEKGLILRSREQALMDAGKIYAPWEATADALKICAMIKHSGRAELNAMLSLYQENRPRKCRGLALFLLDQLSEIVRNRLICIFTLLRQSEHVRFVISRSLQPFCEVLWFVFDELHK